MKEYHYLALGDSYTIGESVASAENFPNQVYRMLEPEFPGFLPPRIVAKTGWTTDELEKGMQEAAETEPFLPSYDFVSLLIGVNNQYRGRSLENYREEFERLLEKAIRLAGGKAERVVVLSIPDWGVTPFAQGRDRQQIAREIDQFNEASKRIAQRHHIYIINVTSWTREAAGDPSLLAPDGLHPSGKEYRRWATELAAFIRSEIVK